MFINKDLLEFFGSMMEIKKQKRDIFNALAADVDDPEIRNTLLRIGADEQRHVDQIQQSINLVNSGSTAEPMVPEAAPAPQVAPAPAPPAPTIAPATLQPAISIAQPAIVRPEPPQPVAPMPVPEPVAAPPTYVQPVQPIAQPIAQQVVVSEPAAPTVSQLQQPAPPQPLTYLTPTIATPAALAEPAYSEPAEQSISSSASPLSSGTQRYPVQPPTSKTFENMTTLHHPLGEVFGFAATDQSPKAQRYRSHRHCPFNNKSPNCTNSHTENPLGVCSILHNNKAIITCPIRFREDWLITDDAASFFFEPGVRWSSLTDVRLADANGTSAGNMDVMLVAYDKEGKIIDFGAIQIQTAHIDGNVREPFEFYMKDPKTNAMMDWTRQPNYPEPDFLSAMRTSVVPELLYKGGILHSWNKKMAIAINKSMFETLPPLTRVKKDEADIAWLLYELEAVNDGEKEAYQLKKSEVVYTAFQPTLLALTAIAPGNVNDFMKFIPELGA